MKIINYRKKNRAGKILLFMSNSIISIENLTKYFGKNCAVNNISFEVHEGEIFGFLGPNGAGKTTCIKMILDLLRPSSGKINVFGLDVLNNSVAIRTKIGYLPGNFTNFANISGIEFLKFTSAQRRIKYVAPVHLFDRFELSSVDLQKRMKSMSHGMMQKIGIIQAFFHRPELLILDEPTIGLDPLMQESFYELIHDFHTEGATIFFSSHNLYEVERICHNISVIRDGEIVALETLENMKKKMTRKLTITLKNKIVKPELKNAELIYSNGLKHEFLIKGNIDVMLAELNNLPVVDFIFPEPNLDEVFRTYYK